MFGWAMSFLVAIIIAGVSGFAGMAITAARIAKVLFVFGLVMFLLLLVAGCRPRPICSNPPRPGVSRTRMFEPPPRQANPGVANGRQIEPSKTKA